VHVLSIGAGARNVRNLCADLKMYSKMWFHKEA